MTFSAGRYRWWQGVLLGALIGSSAFALRSLPAQWQKPQIVSGLSVDRFTELAGSSAQSRARPTLTDIVIHPPAEGRNLLTATVVDGRDSHPIELLARIPFVVNTPSFFFKNATKSFADVRAYLAAAAPGWRYRYAWWEEPRVAAGLWIGSPILLLGLLIPLTLQALMYLGVISRPPVVIPPPPLPKAVPEPEPEEPSINPTIAAAKLAALESDLEQRMAELRSGDAETPGETAASTASAAPVQLASTPLEARDAANKDPTSFEGGEFYPVHRPTREP